jgi:exodeoxyribonuclease V alpha subunit
MVALPLMAHLLAAVGPHTRLILVGDPHQLASVEAGSVLADIVVPPEGVTADVGPLAEVTTVLTTNFRFAEESGIAEVARAVNAGLGDDAVAALSGRPDVAWHAVDAAAAPGRAVVLDELVGPGSDVVALARSGDADGALVALGACQLLCAHRRGPYGVEAWNRHVGGRLGVTASSPAGRPVLVTRNDSDLGVFNGDVGVVVADGESTRVAFGSAAGTRRLAPVQLEHTETAHALTIHKSQGSEFGVVVVVLPPDGSRLASRQLLYTAVTRAKDRVVVVGTESAGRTAVGRSLARQGGLAERLWCEG